jgi:hypothetical protein
MDVAIYHAGEASNDHAAGIPWMRIPLFGNAGRLVLSLVTPNARDIWTFVGLPLAGRPRLA